MDDMLAAALQYYGEAGLLDATPVPLALEREKPIQALSSPLRYPGKLAADLAGNRLFISDSNNHRWVAISQPQAFLHYTVSRPRILLPIIMDFVYITIGVAKKHGRAVQMPCSIQSIKSGWLAR